MINYKCDVCQKSVSGKTTGFVLNIEPLIEPSNSAVLNQEDLLRLRTISRNVLICDVCYTKLYSMLFKEPMHTQLTITVGDKHSALIMDINDRIITREMRIDLDPGVVHKSIIKYFSEIQQKTGGKPNVEEGKQIGNRV